MPRAIEDDGTLVLEDGVRLGPDLARADFLRSPLGRRSRPGVQNEPWAAWVLDRLAIGGASFRVTVCFSDEVLGMLDLVMVSPELGRGGWKTTPELEQARLRAHQRWLEAQLGPAGEGGGWQLSGAEVRSRFDARACASTIQIWYGLEAEG